jgi:hypothetical protein
MKTSSSVKSQSKQRGKNVLFKGVLALCLCLAFGGGVYAYKSHMHAKALSVQKELAAAEAKAQEEREKRRAEIQILFDAYLNAFKGELFIKANTYKKTRKLLKNLIRPVNYIDTASAKENYFLFKESLAPSLRKQSVDIIDIFERYSNKNQKELADEENDLHRIFQDQWEDMLRDQLTNYINFFAREEELIQAYDALITFYYTHSKRFVVDDLGDDLEFSNPKDKEKAQLLIKRINDLQKLQDQDDDATGK